MAWWRLTFALILVPSGHMAQAYQARLLAKPEQLGKKTDQCIKVPAAEVADPSVGYR